MSRRTHSLALSCFPNAERALARSTIRFSARLPRPIRRIQWCTRPGPSLPWAISKPLPSPSRMLLSGTHTLLNLQETWTLHACASVTQSQTWFRHDHPGYLLQKWIKLNLKKNEKRAEPECPQNDSARTTVTPGVSMGTRTIDCCLCGDGWEAFVLPMTMSILHLGCRAFVVHHLTPFSTTWVLVTCMQRCVRSQKPWLLKKGHTFEGKYWSHHWMQQQARSLQIRCVYGPMERENE